MFYAILAYHVEDAITAMTPQEDAALMADLLEINTRLHEEGTLGPSARLGATQDACTLRGPGDGVIIDGPFAETKEQLLGLYVVDCATRDDGNRDRPRPSPRQSDRRLRDQAHSALQARRAAGGQMSRRRMPCQCPPLTRARRTASWSPSRS